MVEILTHGKITRLLEAKFPFVQELPGQRYRILSALDQQIASVEVLDAERAAKIAINPFIPIMRNKEEELRNTLEQFFFHRLIEYKPKSNTASIYWDGKMQTKSISELIEIIEQRKPGYQQALAEKIMMDTIRTTYARRGTEVRFTKAPNIRAVIISKGNVPFFRGPLKEVFKDLPSDKPEKPKVAQPPREKTRLQKFVAEQRIRKRA